MIRSTPQQCSRIRGSFVLLFAAALGLTPAMARAQQQSAAHPVHTSGTASGVHPRPIVAPQPVRSSVPMATPRTAPVARFPRWPANAGRFASGPRIERGVQPVGIRRMPDPGRPTFLAPIFFRPFSFGVFFPGGLDDAGYISRSDEVPLGFGLWPACDSAHTPGVFWTVGPCFGSGDYSAESTVAQANTELPSPYLLPLFLSEEPQSGAVAPPGTSPAAPAPKMLLYLTDGSTITASDWWVARGRLQYITTSGTTGSMDLSQLDLEQTIKQNEKRGLDFHLRFTPPSDRP